MGEEDVFEKLKGAESYGSEEDVLDKEKEKSEKKKKNAIFIGAGVAVVITAASAFFATDADNMLRGNNGSNEESISSNVYSSNVDGGDTKGKNVKTEESSEISANIPEWSDTKIEYAKDEGDLRREIFASYADTAIRANTYAMSSETNGYYTRGELGSKSVNYTLEEYISSIGEYIERLINPTFGGWSEYQFSNSDASENFPVEDFDDMFSDSYKERYDTTPPGAYFPVYADWEGNDYGIKNLSNAARWHGEIKNMDSTIEDYGGIKEKTTVDVEVAFSSWDEDGKKLEKDGTLRLIVVPGSDSERPLVVEDAILSVR